MSGFPRGLVDLVQEPLFFSKGLRLLSAAYVDVSMRFVSSARHAAELRYRLAVPDGASLAALEVCNARGCRDGLVDASRGALGPYDDAVRSRSGGALPIAHAALIEDERGSAVWLRAAPVLREGRPQRNTECLGRTPPGDGPLTVRVRYVAAAPVRGGRVRIALTPRGRDVRAAEARVRVRSDEVSRAAVAGPLADARSRLAGGDALTATLGVALLTTLTYGLPLNSAMISLLAMYVGAVYGGSYASMLINIPGTAAAATTALDGYPMGLKGEGGRALGLTTTASFIGTSLGTLALAATAPLIAQLALQFTSYEFFLLAFFGIVVSGSLTANDLFYKSWIAGLLGLFLACIGRDNLQSYPRFTMGFSALEGGIEVVPVLIGAFGIPQFIKTMRDPLRVDKPQEVRKIFPDWGTIARHLKNVVRSALIGIGIGAVPGVGEDVAAWVSYGTAKNTSRHPERFGTGAPAGVVACETANNACIGGALIPLLTLGIPGSPPAAMLSRGL